MGCHANRSSTRFVVEPREHFGFRLHAKWAVRIEHIGLAKVLLQHIALDDGHAIEGQFSHSSLRGVGPLRYQFYPAKLRAGHRRTVQQDSPVATAEIHKHVALAEFEGVKQATAYGVWRREIDDRLTGMSRLKTTMFIRWHPYAFRQPEHFVELCVVNPFVIVGAQQRDCRVGNHPSSTRVKRPGSQRVHCAKWPPGVGKYPVVVEKTHVFSRCSTRTRRASTLHLLEVSDMANKNTRARVVTGVAALWVGAFVAAAAACGNDTTQTPFGTSSGAGGDAGGGGVGTTAATGGGGGAGSTATNAASGSGGSGVGGGGATYMCDDVMDEGECTLDKQDPCECCAAEKCFSDLQSCCNTKGCYAVVQCVVKTMCEGLGCYNAATCKSEIDVAGGPFGKGTQAAQAVGDCAITACRGCGS